MTLTIQRQVRLQRLAIALGLAAILAIVAFAAFQTTRTDPVDAEVPNVSVDTVIPRSAAQQKAFMAVQDDYLPPTVAPTWKRLQDLQDNYLPPTSAQAVGEAKGIDDSRTNGPR